jgi:translation initiation factor eIF-2B subunit epsilon
LFGQILASLYQNDIVEEEEIYAWHRVPASRGSGDEGMERTWSIGGQLIAQLAEQDSDDSEEDSNEEESD